jgi:hypothetical protein
VIEVDGPERISERNQIDLGMPGEGFQHPI